MPARNVELFAMPDEMLGWLQEVVRRTNAWCVLERPRIGRLALTDVLRLSPEGLGNEFSRARLFLGSPDMSHPVWESVPGGERLDFVRSQAALFEPSVFTKRALEAGRLAVMAKREYDELFIDPDPVERWYRTLAKSLRKTLGVGGIRLFVVAPGKPRAEVRGSFIVSPGAVAAVRNGAVLKQFAESNVAFEVEVTFPG